MKFVTIMFRAPSLMELEEKINRHLGHMDPDTCQVSLSHASEGVAGHDRFIASVTHGIKNYSLTEEEQARSL
jgi:hypothetical protein